MAEPEIAQQCPVCGSGTTRPYGRRDVHPTLRPEDVRITDDRYGMTLPLRRCDCGFVFAEPDTTRHLVSLYEGMDDPEYERSGEARRLQMRWILDEAMRAYPAARSILDVGAGTGLLVSEARRRGLDAIGVEPSVALVERARTRGVDLLQGVFPHAALTGRTFDLVFLVDVIEHVADPVALLRLSREALAPRGAVVVITPDVGSLAARILGHRWWHFRLAHVGYFNAASFGVAVDAAGLRITRLFRARWFLPFAYLGRRVGTYVPIVQRMFSPLSRFASRIGLLSGTMDMAIPINLRDSFAVFLERRSEPGASLSR